MGAAISRFQLLRGDLNGSGSPVRPPWALAEARFITQCSRCGDCLPACPQHILLSGRGGFPQVDFRRGACLFCGACVQACASGALQSVAGHMPWRLKADIGGQCLALRGVECRVCADHCEPSAIRFQARVGGPPIPRISVDSCSGCGACYAACPAAAVQMHNGITEGEIKR